MITSIRSAYLFTFGGMHKLDNVKFSITFHEILRGKSALPAVFHGFPFFMPRS